MKLSMEIEEDEEEEKEEKLPFLDVLVKKTKT